VRHRLAPACHRETGINGASLAEGVERFLVLEAVERGDAAKEVRLRRRRARGLEVNGPELTERRDIERY